MIETVKRIKRENTLPVFNRLKWKCSPTTVTDLMKPEHSQHSTFSFEFDWNDAGWRVLEGVSRVNDSVIIEGDDGEVTVVVDVKKKELLKVNDEDLSEVKHNQILDLNDEGDRWEGDVLKDSPYGWGVLYDKDNQMVYEGFRIGELNVCYGREYYTDISRIEYEGEWFEGSRWGRGIQYDRNGDVVYDGEWLEYEQLEMRVVITPENEVLHNHIEELVVSDGCCNGSNWNGIDADFGVFAFLKLLKVGNNCFECLHSLRVVGLSELESVVIGKDSFTPSQDSKDERSLNREFHLKNCPKVKLLKIGPSSFVNYRVCVIENVDALEEIEMGDLNEESHNFVGAFSFVLKSILERNV